MNRRIGLVAAIVLGLVTPAARAEGLAVAEAKLGKGVQEREIVDETTTFAVNEKAYLWLRVTGGPGNVNVSWSVADHTDSVPLEIGGSPWRTWSSKTLWRAGEWTVTARDGEGNVLTKIEFRVQ
jgi:hypothetical protein